VLYTLDLGDGQAVASWVSDNIERLTGDTAAEALAPGRWLARVHPEDQGRITLGAAQADDFLEEEFRLLHQSGSCRWICAEQVLIRNAAGAPIEAVGSWSDITARKQTELSLAQSEEQYRLLFSHNPQPMWAYEDSTLAFLAVNEAAVIPASFANFVNAANASSPESRMTTRVSSPAWSAILALFMAGTAFVGH